MIIYRYNNKFRIDNNSNISFDTLSNTISYIINKHPGYDFKIINHDNRLDVELTKFKV